MWSLIDYVLQITPYAHLSGELHPIASVIVAFVLLSAGYLTVNKVVGMVFGRDKFKPKGKHAYITGASQGLGKALAVYLAKKGACVTIVSRDKNNLNAALEEIKAACANEHQIITAISADVTDRAQSIRALDEAAEKHNGKVPDFIFTCAGASTPGIFINQSVEDFEHGMKLNYFGTLYTVHEAAKRMVHQGVKGKIVLVSSVMGFLGFIGYSQYAPTKHAIRGLADCLRNELILYDIDVHCYFPGTIFSPGLEKENTTKPTLTSEIEGEGGSTPEQCVHALCKGLSRGYYFITSDIIGDIFRAGTRGVAPTNNIVIDCLFAGVSWLIAGPFRIHGDWKVRNAKGTAVHSPVTSQDEHTGGSQSIKYSSPNNL